MTGYHTIPYHARASHPGKVVPESCQRTDGIKAWLETKEERENKEFEKQKTRREKEEENLLAANERNARKDLFFRISSFSFSLFFLCKRGQKFRNLQER